MLAWTAAALKNILNAVFTFPSTNTATSVRIKSYGCVLGLSAYPAIHAWVTQTFIYVNGTISCKVTRRNILRVWYSAFNGIFSYVVILANSIRKASHTGTAVGVDWYCIVQLRIAASCPKFARNA
jgi:hypothetical protein